MSISLLNKRTLFATLTSVPRNWVGKVTPTITWFFYDVKICMPLVIFEVLKITFDIMLFKLFYKTKPLVEMKKRQSLKSYKF